MTFVGIRNGIEIDKKMRKLPAETKEAVIEEWLFAMENAERSYNKMLSLGATPQIARGVLPLSTKGEMIFTANLREWRHIFNLRAVGSAGDPHPQMLEIMVPLLERAKAAIPVVFEDLVM